MRSILLVTAMLGSATLLGGAGPLRGPVTTVPVAPIGHLQPRAQQFSPQSPAEQLEQQQMSTYDAAQQKLDEQLDTQLNICRGC